MPATFRQGQRVRVQLDAEGEIFCNNGDDTYEIRLDGGDQNIDWIPESALTPVREFEHLKLYHNPENGYTYQRVVQDGTPGFIPLSKISAAYLSFVPHADLGSEFLAALQPLVPQEVAA